VDRKAGEEWLVTREQACTYIPSVHEKVTATVGRIVLTSTQFWYVPSLNLWRFFV
jgi:hypothetical protein